MPPSGTNGHARTALVILALIATLLGVWIASPRLDAGQVRLCRMALPAINPDGARIEVRRVQPDGQGLTLRIDYASDGRERTLRCGFAASDLDPRQSQITALVADGEAFSALRLHVLHRYWLSRPEAVSADPGPGRSMRPLIYVPAGLGYPLQQLANAVAPTAVLVLLAAAYALIYGLIGRINLAFGQIATIGGVAGVTGVSATIGTGAGSLAVVLGLAALFALWTVLIHARAIERIVLSPLAFAQGQALLIATIALALVIEEYLRLAQGPQMRWLAPVLATPLSLADDGSFLATITMIQATVGIGAAVLALGLLVVLRASGFGRHWRAVAEDPVMAALLGISPRRVLRQSFLIACGFAGLAGFILAIQHGGAGPSGGLAIGLKALAAAVAGGIGSVGGAMAGGVVIGIVEAAWKTWLPMEQVDLVVFSLLAAFIVFRPGGLFGVGSEGIRPV